MITQCIEGHRMYSWSKPGVLSTGLVIGEGTYVSHLIASLSLDPPKSAYLLIWSINDKSGMGLVTLSYLLASGNPHLLNSHPHLARVYLPRPSNWYGQATLSLILSLRRRKKNIRNFSEKKDCVCDLHPKWPTLYTLTLTHYWHHSLFLAFTRASPCPPIPIDWSVDWSIDIGKFPFSVDPQLRLILVWKKDDWQHHHHHHQQQQQPSSSFVTSPYSSWSRQDTTNTMAIKHNNQIQKNRTSSPRCVSHLASPSSHLSRL